MRSRLVMQHACLDYIARSPALELRAPHLEPTVDHLTKTKIFCSAARGSKGNYFNVCGT
jgi:hypothetical protein